jgi:hypothetical protein
MGKREVNSKRWSENLEDGSRLICNTNMNRMNIDCLGVDWIKLAQKRIQCEHGNEFSGFIIAENLLTP